MNFWFYRHITVDDFVDGRAFLFFQLDFKSIDSGTNASERTLSHSQIARSESRM
jgi:hypothetical protein